MRAKLGALCGWVALCSVPVAAALSPTVAAAYQRPGLTQRASVASDGSLPERVQVDRHHQGEFVDITPDGRFVAFTYSGAGLVPDDTNGVPDVFVHDRQTGRTERVSVHSDGSQLDIHSVVNPVISADGRFVAFTVQAASDLLLRVYLHDRATGTTERVDVASDGSAPDVLDAGYPSISADGRYVTFTSKATNLVPGGTKPGDVHTYVRDRVARTTELVDVATDGSRCDAGENADVNDERSSISADGRFVAFQAVCSNLVAGDTNGVMDVFVRDLDNGTTERVSVGWDGGEMQGAGAGISNRAISADGRYVVFKSQAPGLVPTDIEASEPFNGTLRARTMDTFVHDRQKGVTERVSVDSAGAQLPIIDPPETQGFAGTANDAVISPDGRYVAFLYKSNDYRKAAQVGDTVWYVQRLYLHDRATGTTERVDVASDGTPAENEGENHFSAYAPGRWALSDQGRYVAFVSDVGNLVPGSSNDVWDVYVRDRGSVVGVGGVEVVRGKPATQVSGWATFTGETVSGAADDAHDARTAVDGSTDGLEVTAASIVYRPELEDLFIRIGLASLPTVAVPCVTDYVPCGTVGGKPGVVYAVRFTIDQTQYEVRVTEAPGGASVPNTASAALYRCTESDACHSDSVCAGAVDSGAYAYCYDQTAVLEGAIGTTGPEVSVAVPLTALGIDDTATLTRVRASAYSDPSPVSGPADLVKLPDAEISAPKVELGVAAPATPEDEVPFATTADLTDGHFAANLDQSAATGPQRLWARACLADICGVQSVDVSANG